MPRPLDQQVVVITGASSGIGREAAIRFSEKGAAVVLAARNEEALNEVADIIQAAGGRALAVPTDVAVWEQVEHLADVAVGNFGRIDTWVNNAGVSVYATAENTTSDEANQVMRVNFLGVVHGCTAALPYMKQQGYGTIINVGSVESRRALPLQAVYAASKHAVLGYTEALRMEQMYEKSGINVTLVMPSGINTPLFDHARSKVGVKPMPVPPVYKPELVADSIVHAATHPHRDIFVGGAGFLFGLLQRINPALLDKIMVGSMYRMQTTDEPDNGTDNLFQPVRENGRVHGDFEHLVKPSMYTPVFETQPRTIRQMIALAVPATLLALILTRK